MTWFRVAALSLVVLTLTIILFQSNRKSARAADMTRETVTSDGFGEDDSARRFYSSQTRHWRQMVIKR
jgi:hypothetical protein